jgi:hypothetical protein
VPVGATPDDVARCTGGDDVLPARCPASNPLSMCICQLPDGCPDTNGVTPAGVSVGILDMDLDGAADHMRFITGAVGIRCGTIDVSIDPVQSYWTPSGNQEKPAQGGFDVLGPAIVLVPGPADQGVALPAGAECGVVFSADVVDKDGIQVCAPPGGDLAAGCTPGDTSAVKFSVEPMTLTQTPPVSATAQRRDADIAIVANAPLDTASLANITIVEDPATSYTQFQSVVTKFNEIAIHSTAAGGFAAATHYTVTVPTTVTDRYGKSTAQPLVFAFTTAN